MSITSSQITHCAELIKLLLRFDKPADAVMSTYLRAYPKLGSSDRHEIAETAFACLRHLTQLRALLGKDVSARALTLATLIHVRKIHVTEIERALHHGESKWIASLKDLELKNNLSAQSGLPEWIIELLEAHYSSGEIIRLGRSMLDAAPLDLRVNTFKAKRDTVLQILNDDGFNASATQYSPIGIRLKGKPPINRHPAFLAGEIEVQDEGSQLLGLLLGAKRAEMVVDFCAGAGGKTLQIGAAMASTGRLYAFDVAEKRLGKLKPRLARSGLSNVMPQLIAHENEAKIKRLAGKIDRVLIDAPCSGLGTLRRNPDLRYRQNSESVIKLSKLQSSILASASKLLKVGGRLVYATCSFLPQENQQIVEAFLAEHTEFSLTPVGQILTEQNIQLESGDYLQLSPQKHQTDGFFAAVMHRNGK